MYWMFQSCTQDTRPRFLVTSGGLQLALRLPWAVERPDQARDIIGLENTGVRLLRLSPSIFLMWNQGQPHICIRKNRDIPQTPVSHPVFARHWTLKGQHPLLP